jgi:hypothetical protein
VCSVREGKGQEESSFFEKKEAKKLLRHGTARLVEPAPNG